MAIQHLFAFSSKVDGVAIAGGSPYGCGALKAVWTACYYGLTVKQVHPNPHNNADSNPYPAGLHGVAATALSLDGVLPRLTDTQARVRVRAVAIAVAVAVAVVVAVAVAVAVAATMNVTVTITVALTVTVTVTLTETIT